MSASAEVAPSATHPSWCDPRICATDSGSTFHRGACEVAGVLVDFEQVDDGSPQMFVQGLDQERRDFAGWARILCALMARADVLHGGHGAAA